MNRRNGNQGKAAGVRTTWDAGDRREITAHNARHWKRWKAENGWWSVETIPGFEESLRSLLIDQGYSSADVGAFMGVSRERVRQWCARFGIGPVKGSSARRWDWDAERFVPCSVDAIAEDRRDVRRSVRTSARAGRHVATRARHVATLHRLAKRLGRTPYLNELARELGREVPAIAYYWGRSGKHAEVRLLPYTPYLDALWEAAGMKRHQHGDYYREWREETGGRSI